MHRLTISVPRLVAVLFALGAVSVDSATAQAARGLTPGDVVRVNQDFVGTVMSIDESQTLTVIGEGKPRCWPGIAHGEAPRCGPAPSIRRVVSWPDATIERQLEQASYMRRTIVGFVIGAAALGPVGYLTGPSLGYGKISSCVDVSDTRLCSESISSEEAAKLQRAQDQRRGAFFFSVIGGTVGAIIARRTANQWVEVRPPAPGVDGAWGLGVRLPLGGS